MGKLWQRHKDESDKSVLSETDASTLDVQNRHVLIYLPGLGFTHKNQHGLAGCLKYLEEILHRHPETNPNLDLYCFSYPSIKVGFSLTSYVLHPNNRIMLPDAVELAKQTILKCVTRSVDFDKNGNIVHAELLPENDARKNLRNITFYGHSAGTIFSQHVYNASLRLMKEAGFPEENAKELLKEVVLLSTGNVSRPEKECDRFTTICLVAKNDMFSGLRDALTEDTIEAVGRLSKIFNKRSDNLTIKELSPNYLLIKTHLKSKYWEWTKHHDGTKQRRAIQNMMPKWLPIKTFHEFRNFITIDDELNAFSKIAMNTLINASNRTDKTDVMSLLQPAATSAFSEEETALYKERLSKAVKKKNP